MKSSLLLISRQITGKVEFTDSQPEARSFVFRTQTTMDACWSPPCCENKIIGTNLWVLVFFSSVLSCFPALFPTGHFLSFVSVTLISVFPFFSPLLPLPFSCSLMSASLHPHPHTLPDTPLTPDYKVTEKRARSKQPFLPLRSTRKASMQSLFWFHLFKRKEKSSSSSNTNVTPFFFFLTALQTCCCGTLRYNGHFWLIVQWLNKVWKVLSWDCAVQ